MGKGLRQFAFPSLLIDQVDSGHLAIALNQVTKVTLEYGTRTGYIVHFQGRLIANVDVLTPRNGNGATDLHKTTGLILAQDQLLGFNEIGDVAIVIDASRVVSGAYSIIISAVFADNLGVPTRPVARREINPKWTLREAMVN